MIDTEEHNQLEEEISKFTFHLFAIGINSYKYHRNLKTAERGAIEISDVLVDRYGFDRSNVTCLLGEQATADAIDRQLRKYAKTLKPTDALVMFYAGHGEYDEAFTDGTYLIPHDAGKDSTALWIDHDKISRYFGSIKARHILLISDSCFSGGALRWIDDEEPNVEFAYAIKAIKRASRQVITSGGLETVQDRGFGGHSVFSHFLIDYLKTAESRFIGPTDIFQSIMDAVAKNSSQSPDNGRLSQSGDARGFFCLRNTDLSDEQVETPDPPNENATEIDQSSSLKRNLSSKVYNIPIIAMLVGLSLLVFTFFVAPRLLQQDSQQSSNAAGVIAKCNRLASDIRIEGVSPDENVGFWSIENKIALPACEAAFDLNRNNPRTVYQYARTLLNNSLVRNDSSQMLRFQTVSEHACEQNFGDLCALLGSQIFDGNFAITAKPEKAVVLFTKSCELNSNFGCVWLARALKSGKGVQQDEEKAFSIFQKLCDQFYYEGCAEIGKSYANGQGVEKNLEKALDNYVRGCVGKIAEACDALGTMLEGRDGLRKNLEKAYKYFQEGCANGSRYGCYKTATALLKGDGVSKDVSHGISILEVGCAGNFSTSCMQLGFLYERGNEIPQDIGKAIEYFRKSCTAGNDWGCGKLESMSNQN